MYKEYKIVSVSEGALGTLLLGASALSVQRIQDVLNQEVRQGWQVVFQSIEHKRFMLFWTRETMLITFGR